MILNKVFILCFLFFTNVSFSIAFLECEESDTGRDWKNKKLLQTNFYVFSDEEFNLLNSKDKLKKGSYIYNKNRGEFEGPHNSFFTLDFIPIKLMALKKRSHCGAGGAMRNCNKHFSQIDRSTLEIQKYYMDGGRAYFSRRFGEEANLWKVAGMCKVINEDDFFNKTFNLRTDKSKKNKI
tara:strand:- start:348 stop:887 length:540 start_codon:yes stop_codon:yes gene_type:complete